MPPVYGGAPKCPTCGKAVYFAEQVIGPQGSYHKACLKCVACGKSLEPRLLLDHNGEAYCKSCHGKAFGAKGYGAGGALVGEYAPRPSPTPTSSPTRPPTNTAAPPQPAQSPTRAARPVPSVPTPAPVRTEAATARRPLPTPPVAPPKPASIFASTSTSRSTAGPPPPTPPRPASLQPTPTTSAASPTQAGKPSIPAFDAHSTRLSPLPPPPPPSSRPSLSGPSLCIICRTPAYAAESLLLPSLGGLIHRSCFRCAGCGGRLELGREVVREGEGWCGGCYRKVWGVGGGLGGMTRPNLF